MTTSLYKDRLLAHFRKPYKKGSLDGASLVQRGSNPRCGDELDVGLFLNGDAIEDVRFTGRGCSICIASASMMMEAVEGLDRPQMQTLCKTVKDWFADSQQPQPEDLPDALLPLYDVHTHTARKKCVVLSWEALESALDS